MKSIPHTCNASTDMFKDNVRLEDHSDLRCTLGRTWKYEAINEDIKSLRRKLQKILLSPKPLVKIKINKLLAARMFPSMNEWDRV